MKRRIKKKKDREREWQKERKPDSKSRTDDFGIWKPETITSNIKLLIHKRFWKV